MTTIAPLVDTSSLARGQMNGSGSGQDAGLFADTFNSELRQNTDASRPAPAQPDPRPSQQADSTPPPKQSAPADKSGDTGQSKPADNRTEPTDQQEGGGQQAGDKPAGDGKGEAGKEGGSTRPANPAKKDQPAAQAAAPGIVPLPGINLTTALRNAETRPAGEGASQKDALPADGGQPAEGSAGLAVLRELGLRAAGTKAAAAAATQEATTAAADGKLAVAADKKAATADQPAFDKLMDGVRSDAARGTAVEQAADTAVKQAAAAGNELPRDLVKTGAADGAPAGITAPGAAGAPVPGAATAATAAPATGNTAAAQLSVAVPLRQNGWDEAFAQRVTWAVKQGVQEAQVQLNPRELGPVEVRISIQHDQANVSFVAAHAATREAIENAMPRLRDMLSDAGIQLAQSDVSGQSFAQREQAAGGENGSGGGGQGRGGAGVEEDLTHTSVSQVRSGNGLLDYYA